MYDKKKLFKEAIQIIEKDSSIVFADDIITELGISKPTYYSLFAVGTDEYEQIQSLLKKNKVSTKRQLRKNWKEAESSASLQIALYKLLATEKELERLNPPKDKKDDNEQKEAKPLVEWLSW